MAASVPKSAAAILIAGLIIDRDSISGFLLGTGGRGG